MVSDMEIFQSSQKEVVTSPEGFFDITVGGGVIVADFDNDGLLISIYRPLVKI